VFFFTPHAKPENAKMQKCKKKDFGSFPVARIPNKTKIIRFL
jgi:hypothetical protein